MAQTIGDVERLTECQHDLNVDGFECGSLSCAPFAHLGGHRLIFDDEDMAVVMKFSAGAAATDRQRRRRWWKLFARGVRRGASDEPLLTSNVGKVAKILILASAMNGFDVMEADDRTICRVLEKFHAARRDAQTDDRQGTSVLSRLLESRDGMVGHGRVRLVQMLDRCRACV